VVAVIADSGDIALLNMGKDIMPSRNSDVTAMVTPVCLGIQGADESA
jgi:hypothetical protein